MDENKLQVLNAMGFRLPDCCAFCKHAQFISDEEFGTCAIHTYFHQKHSDSRRNVSIHRAGVCKDFTSKTGIRKETEDLRLHGFLEFRET